MTVTVMKASYRKLKPEFINYGNYKRFYNESYQNELVTDFSRQKTKKKKISFEKIFEVCNKILDKYALHKSRFGQGNHSPLMNRELSKAILTRTRLRDKLLKEELEENKSNYNKQKN